jgi:hypothetical protein
VPQRSAVVVAVAARQGAKLIVIIIWAVLVAAQVEVDLLVNPELLQAVEEVAVTETEQI